VLQCTTPSIGTQDQSVKEEMGKEGKRCKERERRYIGDEEHKRIISQKELEGKKSERFPFGQPANRDEGGRGSHSQRQSA